LREILAALNARGGAITEASCRDVMKTDPPTAKPGDTVDHLRGLMTELHITHVPVMDADKLVGILSFYDIARSAIKDVAFENQLLKQYIKNWPA
jgi:CBS domain-containing protein